MKFERVARELYGRPWAITPMVYNSFHEAFQNRLQNGEIEIMGQKFEYPLPQDYTVVDGVAVIEIDGAMGYRLPELAKACMGMVDYADVRTAITRANADPSVEGIVLNINSPGGAVTGLKETATHIKESNKYTVGFSDSLAASAGYYLMAACSSKISTQSAEIGCIGTLMTWIDVTEAMAKEGYKREMIASGKYKGMLFPGLSITDEQRTYLQDEVDYLADEFKEFVRMNTNVTSDEHMEGQTMVGSLAKMAGLVEINAISIATAINEARI